MKKIFLSIIFILIINYSFAQDITTLIKLQKVCVEQGVLDSISIDTMLIKSKIKKTNTKLTKQFDYLLKAAYSFKINDFESSYSEIKKVRYKFKTPDYNNLKYFIQIASFANLKNIKMTAKYFYIINKMKFITPKTHSIIRKEISKKFTRDEFDNALSTYYYYHDRQKILNEIKFSK